MGNSTQEIETVIDFVPEPYATMFKVALDVYLFAAGWKETDPLQKALGHLQAQIEKLRADINHVNERVNTLARRVAQFDNINRLQRLTGLVADIERLRFQIGQQPADASQRSLIARDAGALAELFLNDFDLWRWTDVVTKSLYDDDNVFVRADTDLMPPDFKAYPALPTYLAAVGTWLAAIDFDTGGNYQLVQQRYGDQLRRHIAQVESRVGWIELDEPPATFAEHIRKRIGCYPQAIERYASDGECNYVLMCNNVMDRRITVMENTEFMLPVATGAVCTADATLGIMKEREVEAERGVEALTQLGELLSRVERTGTLREQFIGQFDPTPSHNVAFVYSTRSDGQLSWWKQRSSVQPNALAGWDGPRNVDSGWDRFVAVYPAGGNRFYALQPDGILRWYQHDGFNDGEPQWKPWKPVGSGWNSFHTVFGGSDGVMYAVQTDGILRWYKHDGYRTGGNQWRPYEPVGTGWNSFKTIFSGGKGVIYAVGHDGTLFWYRHRGFETGANQWDGPVAIGSGWQNFSHIFSVGGGVIYAILADGRMLWYKHESWNVDDSILNGEWPLFSGGVLGAIFRNLDAYMRRWQGALPAGSGWTGLRHVFPLLPASPDPVG